MAHEIHRYRAFFVGDAPWHPIRRYVLDREPTTDYATRILMLDDPNDVNANCTVFEMPMGTMIIHDDGREEFLKCETHKMLMTANMEVLGVVGIDRETIQPAEQFAFFEPFRESGLVTLESGMSLRGGSQLVLTAKIKNGESEVIPNDIVKSYLMFVISFDSSIAQTIKFVDERVVCANTLAIAMNEKHAAGTWKNRHTKNVRDRIAIVQDVVAGALQIASHNREAFKYLAKTKATVQQQINYIHNVFDFEDKPDASTKARNKVQSVIDLLDTQRGIDLVPAIRGTMWQAYNAVTEHLTHHTGSNAHTRMSSTLFGTNATTNAKALALALNH